MMCAIICIDKFSFEMELKIISGINEPYKQMEIRWQQIEAWSCNTWYDNDQNHHIRVVNDAKERLLS